MENYERVINVRNQIDPTAKVSLIPDEWKPDIDQRMVVDYMAANRYVAENNPDLQTEIETILGQSPVEYYGNLVQTWHRHHEFFECHLEPLVTRIKDYDANELTPKIIDLLIDAYKTSVTIDNATLAYSSAIKRFVEKHSIELADKYSEDFDDFMAQYLNTATYFSYYTAKNLIISLDKDSSKDDLISLAQEFHGGDSLVMQYRLANLQAKYGYTIPARMESVYRKEGQEPSKPAHISNEDWVQIVALRKCVSFDNIEEYMIATNLEGASGYVLRKILAQHLVDASLIDHRDGIYDYNDDEIIDGLQQLRKRNERLFSWNIQPKVQHAITCSAACATMIESYLQHGQPTNEVERTYAVASDSSYIPGQHYSHLAAEMTARGIDVTLTHSLADRFQKGLLEQHLFERLKSEYDAGLDRLSNLGAEEQSGVPISAASLKSLLQEGKSIILAGQSKEGDYYHSVLLCGLSSEGFVVIDPLVGKPAVWTDRQVIRFADTDIGKWMIVVNGKLDQKAVSRFLADQLRTGESGAIM